MATNQLSGLEVATQADIEAALRPFIERFVRAERHERVISLFLPLKASQASRLGDQYQGRDSHQARQVGPG